MRGYVTTEKIESMLKLYRDKLEEAKIPPIDFVKGIQTQAQISVLEILYIYSLESGNDE